MPACLSAARAVAMFQIACSKAAPCSSGSRPLRASSRLPRVQDMLSERRSYSAWSSPPRRGERARGQRDLTRRLADRKTRQLGIAGRRRELGRSSDLIERQRARTQRVVKRRQAP